MIVYRIEKQKYCTVKIPRGSLFEEGRWSTPYMWVVYTSQSVSLAKLETLANCGARLPKNRVTRAFEILDDAPIARLSVDQLPLNWNNVPYPAELSYFVRLKMQEAKYVALMVPSALSFTEYNVLIFPEHPEYEKYVQEVFQIPTHFDPRLK